MKIEVTNRGGESPVVGKYAAQRIRSAIESAASYGTQYVPAEITDCTDSLRAVTTDYAVVTEDDGTPLWSGWLDGRDGPAPDAVQAAPGTGMYLAAIARLAAALRDIRDANPNALAGAYVRDRVSLALSTIAPGSPADLAGADSLRGEIERTAEGASGA